MSKFSENILVLNKSQQQAANPCLACMKRSLCPVSDLGEAGAAAITARTYQAGEAVCKAGDEFDGIYVVRSGFFKSSFIDASGEMQVTGFFLPGDVFGIEGIGGGVYGDNVSALDTSSVCRIPFGVFTGNSQAQDRMHALVHMMSNVIARDRNMIFNLGKMDSRRRFAVFLLDIADRMGRCGYNDREFNLCMSRTDISNYLCLAIETVSRLFSQFHAEGIIHVDRRELRINDRSALESISQENQNSKTVLLNKAG